MTDIADYFIAHARLSRRTLARFAEMPQADIDRAADDLGFGPQLRLDEAEEVLAELEEDDDAPDGGDGGEDDDEDQDDDPDVE